MIVVKYSLLLFTRFGTMRSGVVCRRRKEEYTAVRILFESDVLITRTAAAGRGRSAPQDRENISRFLHALP